MTTVLTTGGAVSGASLTMATGKVLGRSTAGDGAVEEISVGSGLSLAAGILTATGSGGTVTSVAVSGGTTGLTTSGGPVTGSGTITLAGTLAVANGGTGQATAALGADALLGGLSTTQGAIAYRAGSAWAALSPGTAGQILQSGGAAANPSWASPTYDLALYIEGAMSNAEEVLRFVAPRAFSLPSGAAGSYGKAQTAATGSTTLTIYKNAVSFGTLVWAGAGTAATVTIGSTTSFVAGDVLSISGPATADATLANIAISLAGSR